MSQARLHNGLLRPLSFSLVKFSCSIWFHSTLTQHCFPDDENGTSIGQEQTTNWNHNMEGCESTKPTVGMKRPIDSES
ncbi:hypothetical protein ACFX13_009614 [Malus domestica]